MENSFKLVFNVCIVFDVECVACVWRNVQEMCIGKRNGGPGVGANDMANEMVMARHLYSKCKQSK